MLEFKKITKKDFQIIDKYFALNLENLGDSRFCDYAPGTVKMWHEAYSMEYATEGDVLYLRANYEEESGISYLMPVGKTSKGALCPLYEYIKTRDSATLSVIPDEMKGEVARVFGVDEAKMFFERDWSDYIYLRKDFCAPSGKKHHSYKNHLNRFAKEHPDHTVEPLTQDNAKEAASFYRKYCENNPETSSIDDSEYMATLPVIADCGLYSMVGAVLRIDQRIIGLTIGEIYGDTVIVHTEKAEKEIVGAYQTLAREFQLMMPESVVYINREEDMGLEGLRRSKMSYAPVRLDNKYTLYLK